MAMKALDVEAVQAFVLVADLNSFTRAAEALDTTQSAVSLKIKRLEDGLGRRLLERTPRMVRLSAEGSVFLGSGPQPGRRASVGRRSAFTVEHRRLIVGISHHIVGTELAALLKRMNANDPGLVMELHIDASRAVLAGLRRRRAGCGHCARARRPSPRRRSIVRRAIRLDGRA